eukprot:6502297-Alexandrium_andersonii.AAC.1
MSTPCDCWLISTGRQAVAAGGRAVEPRPAPCQPPYSLGDPWQGGKHARRAPAVASEAVSARENVDIERYISAGTIAQWHRDHIKGGGRSMH